AAAIDRIAPSEILIPDKLAMSETLSQHKNKFTPQSSSLFDSQNAQKRLEATFGVGTLEAFGALSRAEVSAAGALLDYVNRTQKGKMPHIFRPRQISSGAVMDIDPATRRSLEITRTQNGERRGSLLDSIDCTITGCGARLLQTRLSAPLTDLAEITRRQDEVEIFAVNSALRTDLRSRLKEWPDLERALSRLTIGRGGPRDLGMVRDALSLAETLRVLLANTGGPILESFAQSLQSTNAVQ